MKSIHILILFAFIFFACEKNKLKPTGKKRTYELAPYGNDSNISGTATLEELRGDGVKFSINLENTNTAATYIAHIHSGNTDDFGPIVVYLGYIYGDEGSRSDYVYELDNRTLMEYSDWLNYEGYIAIHLRDNGSYPVLAVGNIGASQ